MQNIEIDIGPFAEQVAKSMGETRGLSLHIFSAMMALLMKAGLATPEDAADALEQQADAAEGSIADLLRQSAASWRGSTPHLRLVE